MKVVKLKENKDKETYGTVIEGCQCFDLVNVNTHVGKRALFQYYSVEKFALAV